MTRNNDLSLAFRNGGVPGHHSLAVRLRGRPGNPTAVGARLTLVLSDGSIQVAEISAGSGYYSQSSAACFFGWLEAEPWSAVAGGTFDGATAAALNGIMGRWISVLTERLKARIAPSN